MSVDSGLTPSHNLADLPPDTVIFGKSIVMLELRGKITRICSTKLPVLLQGESGTGKDLISKFIHNHSYGLAGPWVSVDCANDVSALLWATPSTFVECEPEAPGTILPANGDSPLIGTLFLDHIGELSPELQLRLLHSLRDDVRYGQANHDPQVPQRRIISATARNLRQEVNAGRFRRDLFYRLAVVTLEVPPLRNRPEDLLTIADYLRQQYSARFGLPEKPFPDRLIDRMHYYEWPGNIRELESFVCRYLILGSEERVLYELSSGSDATPIYGMVRSGGALLKEVTKRNLVEIEREMIVKALRRHDGNLKKAADTLGISYRTLTSKMDQAGLPRVRHFLKSRPDMESK